MKKTILTILSLYSIVTNAQQLERYKKLKDTVLISEYLNYEKSVSIYMPVEWQSNIEKTFPLTIVFDRQNTRIEQHIIRTIDFLTSTDQMPSTVIVSVNSKRNKRFTETSYPKNNEKGSAEKNKDFLFKELIPFTEKNLKTNSFRLFIGHSRYGYFVSDLFANHTKDLNAVIAIEPFFTINNINLLEDFEAISHKKVDYHKYFRYTIGRDSHLQFNPAQESFANINKPKINTKGTLYPESDHFAIPALTVSNSLYDIFEFWSKQQNDLRYSEFGIDKIEKLQHKVKKHYGENLTFSLSVLYGIGFTYYNKNEYAKSIKVWSKFLEYYPNFSEAYLNIMKAEKKLSLNTEQTILKFKSSLKNSDFYSDDRKTEMLKSLE
jgi:tetratricopeptide (TPR) repeat protein